MQDHDQIRELFPTGVFGPPCSPADIAEAETLLGHPFPAKLRDLYLHFNGFYVDGWMATFFPLLPKHSGYSVVKTTRFWRNDPYVPVKDKIIFFGLSCQFEYWGVKVEPPQVVVAYNADLEEPRVVGKTILEAILEDEAWYQKYVGPMPDWRR